MQPAQRDSPWSHFAFHITAVTSQQSDSREAHASSLDWRCQEWQDSTTIQHTAIRKMTIFNTLQPALSFISQQWESSCIERFIKIHCLKLSFNKASQFSILWSTTYLPILTRINIHQEGKTLINSFLPSYPWQPTAMCEITSSFCLGEGKISLQKAGPAKWYSGLCSSVAMPCKYLQIEQWDVSLTLSPLFLITIFS